MTHAQRPRSSATTAPSTSLPASSDSPQRLAVRELFKRLQGILGTALGSVYSGADADLVIDEWGRALASFTEQELRNGLDRVATRRFAPNLPEFLQLCRPALDPETAWNEAAEGMREHAEGRRFAWSHPAVYFAAREMNYELRTSTFRAQSRRWEYELACQWSRKLFEPIPDPTLKRLAEPVQQECTPSVLQHNLERLNRIGAQLRERMSTRSTTIRRAATGEEIVPGSPEDEQRTRALREASAERAAAYARAHGIPL
jgi:hypothetical protein